MTDWQHVTSAFEEINKGVVLCCLVCKTEWRLGWDGKDCWSCGKPGTTGGLSQNGIY